MARSDGDDVFGVNGGSIVGPEQMEAMKPTGVKAEEGEEKKWRRR